MLTYDIIVPTYDVIYNIIYIYFVYMISYDIICQHMISYVKNYDIIWYQILISYMISYTFGQ